MKLPKEIKSVMGSGKSKHAKLRRKNDESECPKSSMKTLKSMWATDRRNIIESGRVVSATGIVGSSLLKLKTSKTSSGYAKDRRKSEGPME